MEESIFQIAEQVNQLNKKSYDIYFPLVDDVCRREVSEKELSYLLDYLLDFACDEKMLELYKKVCRRYYILIRVALSLILMHIGRCGKMKMNDCSIEFY